MSVGRHTKLASFALTPGNTNHSTDLVQQATGASFEFAVNPHGLIALMNIMSLTYSAKTYTWFRTPLSSELPHIGTPQDIAWAMWNRVHPPDLAGLKYLLVTQVMNANSRELFRSALETLVPPQSEYKLWPGHEFSLTSKGGQAILGTLHPRVYMECPWS